MIVDEHDRSGAKLQGRAENLSRVHEGTLGSTGGNLCTAHQAVTRIEAEYPAFFHAKTLDNVLEKIRHTPGCIEAGCAFLGLFADTARDFHHRHELERLDMSDALVHCKILVRPVGKISQRACSVHKA